MNEIQAVTVTVNNESDEFLAFYFFAKVILSWVVGVTLNP